jgi:hypothetical protein
MSSGNPFKSWQEVVRVTAALSKDDPDRTLVENLLASQWAKDVIKLVPDVTSVLDGWNSVRALCVGGRHARAA